MDEFTQRRIDALGPAALTIDDVQEGIRRFFRRFGAGHGAQGDPATTATSHRSVHAETPSPNASQREAFIADLHALPDNPEDEHRGSLAGSGNPYWRTGLYMGPGHTEDLS